MRPSVLLPALFAVVLVPACTFVKMAPGADEVSVVAQGRSLAGCEKRGEVEVSVQLETRGHPHGEEVLAALADAGYRAVRD